MMLFKPIFPGLRGLGPYDGELFLGCGIGIVIAISQTIAFKQMTLYDMEQEMSDKLRSFRKQFMEESRETIAREAKNLAYFEQSRHISQHILQPCLCVPEGIFFPRMRCNLKQRLLQTASLAQKYSWMRQLADGAAWLENVGYIHGDLHPSNILVDFNDNLMISDFGSSAPIGEDLYSAAEVFCPDEFGTGDKRSELYALGWCLYNIFHGSVPESFRLVGKTVVFPDTSHLPCRDIIIGCWSNRYSSVAELSCLATMEWKRTRRWYHVIADYARNTLLYLTRPVRRQYLLYSMRKTYGHLRNSCPSHESDVII